MGGDEIDHPGEIRLKGGQVAVTAVRNHQKLGPSPTALQLQGILERDHVVLLSVHQKHGYVYMGDASTRGDRVEALPDHRLYGSQHRPAHGAWKRNILVHELPWMGEQGNSNHSRDIVVIRRVVNRCGHPHRVADHGNIGDILSVSQIRDSDAQVLSEPKHRDVVIMFGQAVIPDIEEQRMEPCLVQSRSKVEHVGGVSSPSMKHYNSGCVYVDRYEPAVKLNTVIARQPDLLLREPKVCRRSMSVTLRWSPCALE